MNDLLKPRTLFAALFYMTFCYLILRGAQIPPELNTIVSGLFGYWYGSKKKEEQK